MEEEGQTMKDFAAIDFETANGNRSSVCSVGLVIVRDGRVTDRFYRLIRPYPNFYSYWNTQVHGLTWHDTAAAAPFPDVWKEAAPLIGDLPLVAHNSPFDEGCLKAVFQAYGMDYPAIRFTVLAALRAASSARNFPIISCTPWRLVAVTI